MTLEQIKKDLEAMGVKYKDKDFQDPHANIRNYSNIENTIHALCNNKRVCDITLISNLAMNSLAGLSKPCLQKVIGNIAQHNIASIKTYAVLLFNGRTKRPYVECRVYLCNKEQVYYYPSADDYDAGYNKESLTPPHILYRWYKNLVIKNRDGSAVHIRV